MAYDYADFAEGRLVSQLATGTTTGVTLTATQKDTGSYVQWPTGTFKMILKRQTARKLLIEKVIVASASQSGATVTLGTLTRNISLTDGSDTTGTSATITWPAGTLCYVSWDTTDAEQTPKKNETNTFTGSGAIRSTSTTTPVIRLNNVTTAQRSAMTPANGDLVYDTDENVNYQYVGGSWTAVGDTGTPTATESAEGKVELATVAEHDPATTGAKVIQAKNVVTSSTGAAEKKLVGLNASSKVDVSILGTGTPGSSNYLRGDGSWQLPPMGTQILSSENLYVDTINGCSAAATESFADTIAFDAASSGSGGSPTATVSHTVGSGSNRILLVTCGMNNTGTVSGVTYGGVSMKLIKTYADNGRDVYIYGMYDPPSGANNIIVTHNSLGTCYVLGASYTGVSQIQPSEVPVNGYIASGTTVTLSGSSVSTGCWLVGAAYARIGGAAGNVTAGTGCTLRVGSGTGFAFGDTNSALNPGSNSMVFNVSGGATVLWGIGCFLVPQPTGGTIRTLGFAQSVGSAAVAEIPLPLDFTTSFTATFIWSSTTASGDVVWGIAASAVPDNTLHATAYGTAQTVTDSCTGANKVNISSVTSSVTPGGTPSAGKPCWFRVYRDGYSSSDTLAGTARLIAVVLTFS